MIVDGEDCGGGGDGSAENEKRRVDFDISEVDDDDDGVGDDFAAAADNHGNDDTMFCRRRPNTSTNIPQIVEVSVSIRILDRSSSSSITEQQRPGEECIGGPKKQILRSQSATSPSSSSSLSPSTTGITAIFHQRAQGSERDQSEDPTRMTTTTTTTTTTFDLQAFEVAVKGLDVAHIPPRVNLSHHSAAAATTTTVSPALSLQDIASLLQRTLREVEDRIEGQQLIENEDDETGEDGERGDNEKEESNPASEFDFAKQRSLRHHEKNNDSLASNNNIDVDECRNGDSKKHNTNLLTNTGNESSCRDGGVDFKNGKSKYRHIHKLYGKSDDSMWWHRTMMKCLRGSPRKIKPPPPFTWTETGWTFLGVSVTLLLLFGFNAIWEKIFENRFDDDGAAAAASHRKQMTGVVLGPFGALLTLQFGVTSAPLGQPKNILYGQVSALVIGFVIGSIEILPVWLRQTLSTVLAICFMVRCGITHPPAGAAALLVSGQKITYLSMSSTLIANVIAIGSSAVLNNLSTERQYPMSWNLSWPELKDCLTNTVHGMCAGCYDIARAIRYNKFWGKGDSSEGGTEYDDDDDDDDTDEWGEILPPKFRLGSTFDEKPTLSPSSSILSSTSLTSSLRRTQRYSYSTLQWQSLRRANSGVISWLSSQSLSLSSSMSSMRGGNFGTENDMVQPPSQDDFLLDETTQITDGDGTNGSSAGGMNSDGGGAYGSIGLPI